MGGGDACELCHWDLRRSSYRATKRVKGVTMTMMMMMVMGGRRRGRWKEGRRRNAGDLSFKTRTQHHRMVGKGWWV